MYAQNPRLPFLAPKSRLFLATFWLHFPKALYIVSPFPDVFFLHLQIPLLHLSHYTANEAPDVSFLGDKPNFTVIIVECSVFWNWNMFWNKCDELITNLS